jgi:hypothetical protein
VPPVAATIGTRPDKETRRFSSSATGCITRA